MQSKGDGQRIYKKVFSFLVMSHQIPVHKHYKKTSLLHGNKFSQFPCTSELRCKHFRRKSVLANKKHSQFPCKFARENVSTQICNGRRFVANLRRKRVRCKLRWKMVPRKFAIDLWNRVSSQMFWKIHLKIYNFRYFDINKN